VVVEQHEVELRLVHTIEAPPAGVRDLDREALRLLGKAVSRLVGVLRIVFGIQDPDRRGHG